MRKTFLLTIVLFLLATYVWADYITPIRTDVSGFPEWTDTNVAGTTYLQLLVADANTISPALNFDNYTAETLDFKARTYGGVNAVENEITVSISTNNGVDWTVLGTRLPLNTTLTAMTQFDLSSYSGTQVRIKFSVAGTSNTVGAGIDDIEIQGTPTVLMPTITVSTNSLVGFSYVVGNGPSAEQSFTVSGSDLTTNITIDAPTNYEISTETGDLFTATDPIVLTQSGGDVAATTIYVRLKANLGINSYNDEVINLTSSPAEAKTVTCSGSVTTSQYLVNFEGPGETKTAYASGTVNLSGLDWDMTLALIGTSTSDWKNGLRSARLQGYGTSSMTMLVNKTTGLQTLSFQYRRYGTDVQVDWKAEYSTNDGSSWTQIGSDFTAPASDEVQTFSEVVNVGGNVRIRIKRATETGTTNARLNIDDITLTDYTGTPTPSITLSTATLTGFTYAVGNGPSTPQTFTISGADLTNNISIAASTNYEISLTAGSGYTTPIVLTQTGGVVAETTIYVRLKSGLTAGDYNGETIVATSSGAADKTVTCSGSVIAPTPTIAVNPSTLTGFNYVFGNGPSATQTFSVSGTFLTENISIAATTNYEISLTAGSGYTTPIVLTQTGGVVPETTIYVRLKAGLAAGSYNAEQIVASSSGAMNQTVTCSGYVSEPAPPTIFLEENFEYVAGSYLHDNGWTAHSGQGTNPPIVGNTNLSYVGYPLSSGLCGETVNTGEDVHKTFTNQTMGSVYTSFLINVTSATEAGDYVFHFGPNPIGTDFKAKFFVGRDASNNVRFGITKAANVGTAVAWTDYIYAYNTTYLVVLKYTLVDGSTNDIVTAWINPDFSGAEPAPMLSAVVSETDIGAAGVGSVALRQSNAALTAKFDGIRVTNDWAKLFEAIVYTGEIVVDPPTLNSFTAIVGSESAEQTYELYGIDLSSQNIDISVTGPFLISNVAAGEWVTELHLLSAMTYDIAVKYVPTEEGTQPGAITHSVEDNEAAPVIIDLSGTATTLDPAISVAPSTMSLSVAVGSTAVQSATITSANQTQPINIALASAGPFTFSATEAGTYASTLQLAANYNGTFWIKFTPTAIETYNNTITLQSGIASDDIIVTGYGLDPNATYATDLFFSEYIEGSSNNKALEIFNGTGHSVDLSDYKVVLYSNGSATPGNTLTMTGTLAHNDVYVIANSSAIAGILALADITSTVTYFNGDDAVALEKISTASYVDIFGVIGNDPGTAWTGDGGYSTLDKTLVRKSFVTGGVTVNPSGTGPEAFTTLTTEWDLYPIDTYSDLGSHTFLPGLTPAEAPEFSVPAGVVFAPFMLSLTTTTPGGQIRYTTDGSDPDELSTLYSVPFQISTTTTVKARTYADGYSPSSVASATYIFPTQVPDIATLRAQPTGSTYYYMLTGEAVLTFQQATRHQKYIQDATAAILIDDAAGVITTTYNLYDGITGISGTLTLYNGLLQFVPVTDPGAATSINNVVIPEVRTLLSLTSDDQAKLIKVMNVDLDYSSGNFLSTAQNINATDPTATRVMRTFPNTDYSLTPIPDYTVDIVCLVGQYNADMQISPRFLSDFSPSAQGLDTPVAVIYLEDGSVKLSWAAITGATGYKVYAADDPEAVYPGGWTLITPTPITGTVYTYTGMEGYKFFKVTANN